MTWRSDANAGLLVTGDGMGPDEVAVWARRAEEGGFESVWVPEAFWDVIVPLALVAAATSRVRLGTATAVVGRHPHVLQLAVSALDSVSNGRLALGVSDGPSGPNLGWYGERPANPVKRMQEYVEVLRAMLTAHSGRSIDYHGEYYDVAGYQKWTTPVREKIPILVAGSRPGMIRLAGAIGDGFIGAALNSAKFFDEVALPALEEGLETRQRTRDDFEVATLRICCVNEDSSEARHRARSQIAFYAGIAPALAEVFDLHGMGRARRAIEEASARGDVEAAAASVPDEAVEAFAFAGTAEECHAQLEAFATDVDTLILYPPSLGHTREEIEENHWGVIEAFGREQPVGRGA